MLKNDFFINWMENVIHINLRNKEIIFTEQFIRDSWKLCWKCQADRLSELKKQIEIAEHGLYEINRKINS